MFGGEDTKEKLRKLPGGPTAPLTVHLRQELDRLNTITKVATQTLKVGVYVYAHGRRHLCACVRV
jgi:dynein heavy chain